MLFRRRTGGCIALAWFPHRRFESLTPPLKVPRHVLTTSARKPWRDLILGWRTFQLLWRTRPDCVLVQNPSLVSTLWVYLLRPIFGYRLVQDAHGDAVIPYAHNWALVRAVTFQLLRRCEYTIVTNECLAQRVREHDGEPFVLCDNLPHVPDVLPADLGAGKHVLFISTYASDEPHAEVFAAARALGASVTVHVTGRIRPERLAQYPAPPENVRLTGFLSEEDYWRLLKSADVVLDLTTMADCLVCGGYEAIAAHRALVLTDNPPSRELFGPAALFTDNTASAIEKTLRDALDQQTALQEQARAHANHMQTCWNARAARLKQLLHADSTSQSP